MSINYNSKIATNGLVCYLDAANPKSYNASENLVTYSTYNSSTWSNIFPTYGSLTNNIDAPDGSYTAVRFTGTLGGNSLLRVTFPSFTPSGTEIYTTSFYARLISGDTGTLSSDFNDGSPSGSYVGSLVLNKWVRLSFTATPTATLKYFIDLASDSNHNYVVDYWGVQVEKNDKASVYKPTNGSISPKSNSWINVCNTSNFGNLVNSPLYNSNGYISFSNTYSQHCSVSNYIKSNTFSNRTISAWFRCTAPNGSGALQGVVNIFDSVENNPQSSILLDASGTSLNYYVYPETSLYGVSSSISQNTWYNFVGVENYDAGQRNIKAYLNGAIIGETYFTANNYSSDAVTIKIGCQKTGFRRYFNGDVALVKVYDRSLTSEEINQNFNAMRGRFGI